MTERVTIPSPTGALEGALAVPAGGGRGAGVVVLPEWWGLNPQIHDVARRWAEAGFVALVPDLYHGVVAATAEEAGRMMDALDRPRAVREIGAAVEYLRAHPRGTGAVAVTGYCMGGALALAAAVAVRGLACAVPYYGLPGDLDWSLVDAPIQAHFAAHDDWATAAGAREIAAVVRAPMEVHVYDARHAFANERRPEVYDREAAELAWQRTLAFVREHTAAR